MTAKTRKEILDDAFKEGATLRLSTLNHERDALLSVLGDKGSPEEAKAIITHVKRKHWTQRPENRARVLKQMRRAASARAQEAA